MNKDTGNYVFLKEDSDVGRAVSALECSVISGVITPEDKKRLDRIIEEKAPPKLIYISN